MHFEEFKRAVLTPYWTPQPLLWTTPEGIGLDHFAREGKVGLFNLGWWMLNRTEPPAHTVYRNTPLLWAILTASDVFVQGRSLQDHAALKTQGEWQRLLLSVGNRHRLAQHGMTAGMLEMLANRKVVYVSP